MPIKSTGPVRSDGTRRPGTLFYLAVFALTGTAVFCWGRQANRSRVPETTHSATARVVLGDGLLEDTDAATILRRIASEDNVRRAAQVARLAPASEEELRATLDGLRVRGDDATGSGEWALSITARGTFAEHPDRLVNALAESFAEGYRGEWDQWGYERHASAQEATSRAQREFLEAKGALEAFYSEQIEDRLTAPLSATTPPDAMAIESMATDPAEVAAEQPELSLGPTMVENPEWTELKGQLTALRDRLAALSIDRTPLHPEVLNVEHRIAELERRLALAPREIPGEPPAVVPRAMTPEVEIPSARLIAPVGPTPEALEQRQAERSQRYAALKEATDRAADVYIEAFDIEQQAWRDRRREPRVEIEPAEAIVASPALPAASPWAAVLGALGGGMAMVLGLGMISTGAAIQPAITSVERVGRIVAAPIVGVVPESRPSSRAPGRRFWARWRLILTGVTLIVGFAALLVRTWGG